MLPFFQRGKAWWTEHVKLWFSSPENGGHRANRYTKFWRDRHIGIEIAPVSSPGAQAAEAINWKGYLKGNFYELLEMGCGRARKWELLSTAVLGRPPHFLGFCLQEPHRVLTVKIMERSPWGSGRGRGRIIMKYTQSILQHRNQPYPRWWKGASPTQTLSSLSVSHTCKKPYSVMIRASRK